MPLSSVLQAFKTKTHRTATTPRIRVGLVGAGRMGQLHARLLRAHPQGDFVGIADSDLSRGAMLAKKFRPQAVTDESALLGRVDAMVVAVPTQFHGPVGKIFLEAGVH